MIELLFVGDGERDAVTLPRIMEIILGVEVRETTRQWARLHGHGLRGFGRKLMYAKRQVGGHV